MKASSSIVVVSPLAVTHADVVGLDFLRAQHQHVGHTVDLLGLTDLVADLLVGFIQNDADAGGLQLGSDILRVVQRLLADGQHLDLRGEPAKSGNGPSSPRSDKP